MPRSRSPLFAAALFGATQFLAADGPCADPATVAAEIDAITSRWNIDVDPTQKNRTEALCALAGRMPRSVEAQIACQDARATGQEGLDAERQRARRVHDAEPDSPIPWFLFARILPDDEAAPAVDSLIAKYPDFPWGHLRKASLAARRKEPVDQEALRSSLTRFFELCPESTAAYRYASAVADAAFARDCAARLRELLQRNPTPVLAYWTLWRLEFKAEPASGHEAIRTRVRADLARLEPSLHRDPDKASILLEGHALLGDSCARAATEDRILASIPGTYVAFEIEESRFERLHPGWEPKATFEAATDWIRRWPDYPTPWVYRLGALRETSGGSDDDAIRTGDGLLRALRLRPLDVSTRRPFPIQVAELWVSRGVRLQEVIRLADQAVVDTDRHLRARAFYTPKDHAELLDEVRWLGKPLRVEALASTGRRDDAVRVLAEMEAPSAIPPGDPDPLTVAGRRSMLERARAGLALADGNTEKALTHYRAAVRSFEKDSRAMSEPREALRRAKLLLPASDDATLDRWLTGGETGPHAVSAVAFKRRNRMLPHGSLRNIDGSTSSIPDPKRRTVVVAVIWATWCGPCREELPFVQKLHERLLGNEKAALLTLTIDDNPGLVAPFLRENRYTFPTLLASDYVAALPERDLSVPRTWIVSPEGRVVLESSGFVAGEPLESWLRRVEGAVASATGSSGR